MVVIYDLFALALVDVPYGFYAERGKLDSLRIVGREREFVVRRLCCNTCAKCLFTGSYSDVRTTPAAMDMVVSCGSAVLQQRYPHPLHPCCEDMTVCQRPGREGAAVPAECQNRAETGDIDRHPDDNETGPDQHRSS